MSREGKVAVWDTIVMMKMPHGKLHESCIKDYMMRIIGFCMLRHS
uniref:Uncharacterized protein n=1 Tax=Picea sitchensis TaxID=3332 RepID=D5ACK9_PICSI|nr:unknown [Picea sitchensis]